jgi:[histone H3]-lysine36 N-dimethyltransferase SETMAR
MTMIRFPTRHSTNTIEQPPYSPGLAPTNFFLFPKFKLPLRGTRFQSVKDKGEFTAELNSIPETALKKCLDDWISRWRKCIIFEGTYFEGDKINLDE